MAAEKKPGIFSRVMGAVAGGVLGVVAGAVVGAFKILGSTGVSSLGTAGGIGAGIAVVAFLALAIPGALIGAAVSAYQGIKEGAKNGFTAGLAAAGEASFTWSAPSPASPEVSKPPTNQAETAPIEPPKFVAPSADELRERDVNASINKEINIAFTQLNNYVKNENKGQPLTPVQLDSLKQRVEQVKGLASEVELSSNNKTQLKNLEVAIDRNKPQVASQSSMQATSQHSVSNDVRADYESPRARR